MPQEKLPHFDFEKKGNESGKGDCSCARDKSSKELSDGKREQQLEGVRPVISVGIEQMGQPAEDYEGNKLKEDQFEGDIGVANKVKELKGYGKICNGNEEITDFLANQDALYAPNPFLIITVAVSKLNIYGINR